MCLWIACLRPGMTGMQAQDALVPHLEACVPWGMQSEAVRPGIECQVIDRAARQVIDAAGYGEQFIHRTGHGVGLTTLEPPYMVEDETRLLEPSMCSTS